MCNIWNLFIPFPIEALTILKTFERDVISPAAKAERSAPSRRADSLRLSRLLLRVDVREPRYFKSSSIINFVMLSFPLLCYGFYCAYRQRVWMMERHISIEDLQPAISGG